MRRTVRRAGSAAVLLAALTGCANADAGTGSAHPSPRPTAKPYPEFQTRIDRLQAQPCHTAAAAKTYPTCGEYVAQTRQVALDVLAGPGKNAKSPMGRDATDIITSTGEYAKLACTTPATSAVPTSETKARKAPATPAATPSRPAATESKCTKGLVGIRNKLTLLGLTMATPPSR